MLPCLLCCLLHHWLVPSSGVAGIAGDLISPCCPVCCVVLFQPRLCHYLSYTHLSFLVPRCKSHVNTIRLANLWKLAHQVSATEMGFDELVAVASRKSMTIYIGFWLVTHTYQHIIYMFIRSHMTGRENSDL